jgi:hypothetical protein
VPVTELNKKKTIRRTSMAEIAETLKTFIDRDINKIVMSNSKTSKIDKEDVLRTADGYQSTKYVGSKVFHKNIEMTQLITYISGAMTYNDFHQLNAWDSEI